MSVFVIDDDSPQTRLSAFLSRASGGLQIYGQVVVAGVVSAEGAGTQPQPLEQARACS